MSAAQTLAAFACELTYERIPQPVVERAKATVIDTVAAAIQGAALPWSRIVRDHAAGSSASGQCSVAGSDTRFSASAAALVNGASAHAFELDSLIQPSIGVHPGASLVAPGLAVAQQTRASGRALLTALVAGCEVMCRIGAASRHSSEKLGFHAPGLTGVFGAAVAAGRLLELNAAQLANALGVAGSLCAGIIEFSSSGGGMVKRLHLGRAAEAGVLAANLARGGFTGPAEVLEGKHGFLAAYCRDADAAALTAGLGENWWTLRTTIKCFACHTTAHVPVAAVLELKHRHGLDPARIEGITVAGSEKMVRQHNIIEPQDIAMAQYSAPFCVALAMFHDPSDPSVFSEQTLNDERIRALCRRVSLQDREPVVGENPLTSEVVVRMNDGGRFAVTLNDFPGMPDRPLDAAALAAKFHRLTVHAVPAVADDLLSRLQHLEAEDDLRQLRFGATENI
jgi:2-methylcitrate dehydratase PrpD